MARPKDHRLSGEERPFEVRTSTDLVLAVENTLGWLPPVRKGKPAWRVRQVEAGKLNKARKRDPERLTIENLLLALEHCRRNRIEVKSPMALIYHVDEAVEAGRDERALSDDLEQLLADAVALERAARVEGWERWVGRFTRAQGEGRREVFREWVESGRAAQLPASGNKVGL